MAILKIMALGVSTIAVIGTLGGVAITLLGAVVSPWLAIRRAGPPDTLSGSDRALVVLILGYPPLRSGNSHPVQHWRVRLTKETVSHYHQHDSTTMTLFTGGATRGSRSEAHIMANMYAGQHVLPGQQIEVVLEERATSTWENVSLSRDLLHENCNVIIVSDPLHSWRAQRYWHLQDPSSRGRVFITDRTKAHQGWWIKLPAAAFELLRFIKVQLQTVSTMRRRTK